MSANRFDCIKTLSVVDPAANLCIDEATRAQVWLAVTSGMGEPGSPTARRTFAVRGWRRVPVLACGALLLMVGVALASGLLSLGSPAKTAELFQIPSSGLGAVSPGSARVLALSAPDPQGGAPWGLRVFTTTRGAGCIQVGRLLDGQIGVLGQDGAFGDDGQLHPLPVTSTNELACSALDANGHIFENVSKSDQLANGLIGPERAPSRETPEPHEVCAPASATPAEQSAAQGRICPQSQERDLYYGLLGPEAQSVTYVEGGKPVTIPTSGPEGAYLIVKDAASGWSSNEFGPGATGNLPVDSPITEVHYANGVLCHIDAGDESTCAPGGIPHGYVPAETTPTPSQTAAAVSSSVLPAGARGNEALISFKAPVAISSVRDQYKVQWQRPGGGEESASATETDVSAGQEITIHAGPFPSGSTEVRVVLQHATGPSLFEGPGTTYVPVGQTTVTMP